MAEMISRSENLNIIRGQWSGFGKSVFRTLVLLINMYQVAL